MDILEAVGDLQNTKQYLRQELSNSDKNISGILHEIEFSKFNACQGDSFARKLKAIAVHRRAVKTAISLFDSYQARKKNRKKGK